MSVSSHVRQILLLLAFAFALVSSPLAAQETKQESKIGDIVVTQAWTRATPNGARIGAGYMTIENRGASAERIVSITTDAALKAEVHEMTMNNGVMSMRPVEGGLTIAPGQTVTLAPNGYHMMFTGLKRPLMQGETLPVTITFEKAGPLTLQFDVLGIDAQGPAAVKSAPSMPMDMKPAPAQDEMKM